MSKKAVLTVYEDGTMERPGDLPTGVIRNIGQQLIQYADNIMIPATVQPDENGTGLFSQVPEMAE